MPNDPPPPDPEPLDLLVVGGLTVDRFAGGSQAPGGSVVHVARAAAPRGLRLGIVTVAGPETVAQRGVDELRGLSARCEVTDADRTVTFRHREARGRRRLWLERSGGRVELPPDAQASILTRAILYAPVAGEIAGEALTAWGDAWDRGAILQGWLRSADEGAEVQPLRLHALSPNLRSRLSEFTLLVASREDLRAEATDPHRQLAALRDTFGPRPVLVVTDGAHGAWVDAAGRAWHVPTRWPVSGVATVGAGDVFAAFLLSGGWDYLPGQSFANDRVERAMRVVAEVLEERRRA